MRFLELRNHYMNEYHWNRRVATLAARLTLGVDTIDGIMACETFRGNYLLTRAEVQEISVVVTPLK